MESIEKEPRVLKLSSLSHTKEVTLKYDWIESGKEMFVQGGDSGIVFQEKGNYCTAFFEAFPKKPSCFIRGEGKTIEEAEEDAWQKYQKILTCNHEMERRKRTDGYGYCKHCTYSATVFEPLTKCCKCDVPTAYAKDFRDKWYCKKHSQTKPKNPKPDLWERAIDRKIPRKVKKQYKFAFEFFLHSKKGIIVKKSIVKKNRYTISAGKYGINPMFKRQIGEVIRDYKRFPMLTEVSRKLKRIEKAT